VTKDVVDHDMGNRISYLISFFFVYRALRPLSTNFFDQILDVMLQLISSPPSEARSPPPARRSDAKKQLHSKFLQLHSKFLQFKTPSYLIFKAGMSSVVSSGMTWTVNGPMMEHVVDHDMGNRISY
jgi:hypothetical protein